MADCFWTDFVKCAEDCGATPVAGPAVLLGLGAAMGSGSSGSGEIIPYFPLTGEHITGPLQFDTVDVYTPDSAADFSGCSWAGFAATTDPALAGTTIVAYDPTGSTTYSITWKLVSDFIKSPLTSGSNVNLASVATTNDLLTALGSPSYDNSGLLIVATLRNTSTNETWEATWALDTCF